MPDVVVVGAGIVGASVACSSARRGADVVLVDKGLPASGVTGESFAWIGASGVPPGPAAALRRAATAEYRRLEQELPAVQVRWSGSLTWSEGLASSTGAAGDGQQRQLGPEQVAALEPHLREPPDRARHQPGDGALDPVAVTEALVAGARASGARVLLGTTVTSVHVASGRVRGVRTTSGSLAAPTVVLAAGVDTPVLCAPVGLDLPVAPSPAVLARFAAPDGLVRTLVATDAVEVRQAADGTLLAALEHTGEVTAPEVLRTAHRGLGAVTALFRSTGALRLLGARVGWRPVPADGEPVVGPVPGVDGLYLSVMHSGVCLAAAVGRLAAQELDGVDAPELHGCRPERFVAR